MTRERGVRKDWVPSRPMAVYLTALAARETTSARQGGVKEERSSMGIMCERVGLQSERALFRWAYGEAPRMSPMMADRILTRLEILWFDVWNEDTVRLPIITVYSYKYRDKLCRGTRRRMRVLRKTTPYGDLGPDHATLAHVRRVFDWSDVEPAPEPVPVPVPVVSLADVPLPIDDPVLGDVQAMKLRRMGLSYRQVAVMMASYHGVHRASTTWRGRLRANGERGRAHGTKNLVNQGLAA